MNHRRTLGDIFVFLLFLIAFSGVSYALVLHAAHASGGGGRIFSIALMWSPGVAAMLTLWLRKLDFASIGWAWGENRWNVLAYLLPLGYAVLAYALVWIFGLGTFADATTTASLARSLGWAHTPRLGVLVGYVVSWSILGLVSAIPTALGEEIGWRGFLVPRIVAQTNFTAGALIVGFIMLLWHLPVILFGEYNQGTSLWVAIPCFAVAVMSASVISTWLRLRSGCIWPCTIFHGVHNLLIQGILTPITSAKGVRTAYFVGEFGLFVPALLLMLAIYFWTRRGELTSITTPMEI
jgi:membrane protease YdiL (CAAX protease family)